MSLITYVRNLIIVAAWPFPARRGFITRRIPNTRLTRLARRTAYTAHKCPMRDSRHVWNVSEMSGDAAASFRLTGRMAHRSLTAYMAGAWRHTRLTDQPSLTREYTASHGLRLAYGERYGLRLAVSERRAIVAAERDERERGIRDDETTWRERNATASKRRARGLRERYYAGLTADERERLAVITPDEADALTEAYTAAQSALTGFDGEPWRGMVSGREARVSPRGASEQGKRGTASRVSLRDAHAATASDEYGLAATTVKPLREPRNSDETMVSRTLTLTARVALEAVPMSERLTWLASLPEAAWLTATVPVPSRDDEPHTARAIDPAEAAARADAAADAEARLALMTAAGGRHASRDALALAGGDA